MDLLLSEQQSLLADSAMRLAVDIGGPKRARAVRNAGAGIDREAWTQIVEAGWLATVIAEEHGGAGLGLFDLALTVEQAGRQLLMVPLAEAGCAAFALSKTKTARALRDLLDGSRLIVPAVQAWNWTYDDPDRPRCEAGVLTGAVASVAYAQAADAFVVATDPEPAVCLVPKDAARLAVSPSANVDGSIAGTLMLDRVDVAADQILARSAAARTLAGKLEDILALLTAVELNGVAQAALEITLDYIKFRQQFGKAIGSFQALQHRAVNAYVDLELNRSLMFRVLAAFDAGECHLAMISAVKARSSRSALMVVREALQMHGAIGYTDEHDIGLYYKRAVALAAKCGNEVQHVDGFSTLTLAQRSPAAIRMTS